MHRDASLRRRFAGTLDAPVRSAAMLPDHDFDPDDNFATGDDAPEFDDEAGVEALIWQWLLLVNPGDDEAAQQQFRDWQESGSGEDAADIAVAALLDATDWRATFRVDEAEPGTLIDAISALAGRFRVEIDWGVEDPTDAAQLAGVSPGALVETAYDQLRIEGYTLWIWDDGDALVSGAIAARDDDEGMRVLSHALGLDLRPGNG